MPYKSPVTAVVAIVVVQISATAQRTKDTKERTEVRPKQTETTKLWLSYYPHLPC